MAAIPVGEAAFAGFGVIRRNPAAVLVWGVVLFVLTIVPITALFGLIGPWLEAFTQLAESGAEPDPSAVLALQMQMMALNPILTLTSLVSRVLLTCAVFRAVLTPQDNRFFYLRLGLGELLVGLVYLCLIILLVLLVITGLGLVMGVSAIVWSGSHGAAVGLGILLSLALMVAVIWLGLRLSMAMPMTLAERRFRFFESWELTRGHAGELFLIALVAVVIVWLLEVVAIGVGVVLVIPFIGSGAFDEASIAAFFERPPADWIADIAPWLLGGGFVVSVLGAVLYTVFTAPWAAAYRALTPPPAPAEDLAAPAAATE